MDDKAVGGIISIASILGIIAYYYLIFVSPWASLTIEISAFLAVGVILLIIAWIGYTLATTPTLESLEDLNLETDENTEN